MTQNRFNFNLYLIAIFSASMIVVFMMIGFIRWVFNA